MKRMAWHWTFGVSAVALAFAACTVTSSDDDDDAGTGGATGGSGGETGGSGGATGGSGGATGGSAGAATGGSAGAATGGSAGAAGSGGKTCAEAYSGTDSCSTCLVGKCCTEIEACVNEASPFECANSWNCFVTECDDPAEYENCKNACDDGNFNVNYGAIVECLETNCIDDCS
jgi:hypothetical protein